MSYSTNFIDDGSRATVTKSTEYVKTTVERREQIEVKTNPGTAYATKHQRFNARPIIGINEDGTFKLGASVIFIIFLISMFINYASLKTLGSFIGI